MIYHFIVYFMIVCCPTAAELLQTWACSDKSAYFMPVTLCHKAVAPVSDDMLDVCLFIKCQRCFDEEQTSFSPRSLPFLITHVATCWLLTADCLSRPQSLCEVSGRCCRCWRLPVQTSGEQLAYHHTRMIAQIVIQKEEEVHAPDQMCRMQFDTTLFPTCNCCESSPYSDTWVTVYRKLALIHLDQDMKSWLKPVSGSQLSSVEYNYLHSR